MALPVASSGRNQTKRLAMNATAGLATKVTVDERYRVLVVGTGLANGAQAITAGTPVSLWVDTTFKASGHRSTNIQARDSSGALVTGGEFQLATAVDLNAQSKLVAALLVYDQAAVARSFTGLRMRAMVHRVSL